MVFVFVLLVCFKAAIFHFTLIALMVKQNWSLQKQFIFGAAYSKEYFSFFMICLNCKLWTWVVSLSKIPLAFDVCNNNEWPIPFLTPPPFIDWFSLESINSKSKSLLHDDSIGKQCCIFGFSLFRYTQSKKIWKYSRWKYRLSSKYIFEFIWEYPSIQRTRIAFII